MAGHNNQARSTFFRMPRDCTCAEQSVNETPGISARKTSMNLDYQTLLNVLSILLTTGRQVLNAAVRV